MTMDEIKKQSLDQAYKTLEIACNENNYSSMISSLKIICNNPLKKRDFIFRCLYVLAKNYYHKEVKELLSMIKLILKREQNYIRIIENTITNNEILLTFTAEQNETYKTALENGRRKYQINNLDDACEIYKIGYRSTKHPVFLYYLGKMMYKKDNFAESMKYLSEYIKLGDEKILKVYLYLTAIYRKKWDYKTALKYVEMHSLLNNIFLENVEITGVFDKDDEEIDLQKMIVQNMENHEFYLFKRKQPSKIND